VGVRSRFAGDVDAGIFAGWDVDKIEAYNALVQCRKNCRICKGLTNPASPEYCRWDSQHIGPWSLWQGSLDAQVMIVGQDWGGIKYFVDWQGRDQPHGNRTNENLRRLLEIAGISIGDPQEPQQQVVFLTNLILCLKLKGGLQGPIEDAWLTNCTKRFFVPLGDIIKPRAVLALGQKTSEAILKTYGVPFLRPARFSDMLGSSPYRLHGEMSLFPLYHCGARGVNMNRSLDRQASDWQKVAVWLRREGDA
jgi:uracil-DNA glycosylase